MALLGLTLALSLTGAAEARAQEYPAWLPRYHLDMQLDTNSGLVQVRQLVTWTNRHERPAQELVFNAHAHYSIADQDVGLLAKMVELLRLAPSEAMSFAGPALEVTKVDLAEQKSLGESRKTPAGQTKVQTVSSRKAQDLCKEETLPFHYPEDNLTALTIALPRPVLQGESVTVELHFQVKVPPKKGRWGQWAGVTTLAQWLPVVAVYDEVGWHPAPFIPWHQPFYNEAGVYTARLKLPADQKLACSAPIKTVSDQIGWKHYETVPVCVRDFSLMCSALYQEHVGEVDGVALRVLALPEHEFFAKEILKSVTEALPVYNRWFGRYPYPQFTVAEAHFGWNGNECGALVMIDSRMMGMTSMAKAYVDYLISHELCHQWWYNVVGTNGYAETWMDEGLATYFSHRLVDQKVGKGNNLLAYPKGLEWLPNIRREDFRNTGYIGAMKRGDAMPTVQEMPKYGHLPNLSAATYDRGSKVVGLIEQRLGEPAMLDFMRTVYRKYQYQIMRVADFQKELEAYSGRSWDDFFRYWVYGKGCCDWAITKVETTPRHRPLARLKKHEDEPVMVRVHLEERQGIAEPTVLGIRLEGKEGYQLRLPILPETGVLELPEQGAVVRQVGLKQTETSSCREFVVELTLPCPPRQISVDPDHVLLDCKPTNNHWKQEIRWRLTPLYTALDEADVTNPHDRWSIIGGPWVGGSAYADPWYVKSPILGARLGAMRTQEFVGGVFAGYRTNDRNLVAGAEALWDHVPFPRTQVGIQVERSLATLSSEDVDCSRGVIFGRYVLTYGSSLYLPPFEYVEAFSVIQNRCLPAPRNNPPGGNPYDERWAVGLHYHKNYLTPYWNPEGGIALDLSFQQGIPTFGQDTGFQLFYGQAAYAKRMPDLPGDGPVARYLEDTTFAFRLGGAVGLPLRGIFFTLGGGDQFRGFDLSERQGSITWVASMEWRLPIFKNVCWDFCDHVGGVRNVYLAPFIDVGDAFVAGSSLGPTAFAPGLGLRVDLAWLGLIERTTFRFDAAKTLGTSTPWQFWFGIQHPF